ncbi:MAG: LptF/LptG family permease [Akkermansia sp.]|nr:LptF/LptG family permease [Akkermansia sp.]
MSNIIKSFLPVLVFFAIGALLSLYLVPAELEQMKWEVPGMPESYPIEQLCRPIFLLLLCFLPFIGAILYSFMGTMDRYMSRNFISYFLMCTLILLLIYILADFTDNMERFRSKFDDPVVQALKFYGSQMPMFLYQILPYTLMMGTMWCLSKLSGTCEITGMMQSGRSLLRLCMPIFLFGSLVSVAYGIFGFHWAPNGMLYRQLQLKQEKNADGSAQAIIYRSETYARHWNIRKPSTIDDPGRPMQDLVIKQFDKKNPGLQLRQYHAKKAVWNKADATWTLYDVYVHDIAPPNVRPCDGKKYDSLVCDFGEKPYQIISPGAGGRIDAMGTSVLYEYIKSGAGSREDRYKKRTEWHVRIARIFSCIVLILLAIPSSVTFQRRGTMKGIGIAVVLAALMLFLYRVFPSLGEAGIIQAWISAWIPNVIYTAIAIYLFRTNLAHRSFKEWMRARLKGEA